MPQNRRQAEVNLFLADFDFGRLERSEFASFRCRAAGVTGSTVISVTFALGAAAFENLRFEDLRFPTAPGGTVTGESELQSMTIPGRAAVAGRGLATGAGRISGIDATTGHVAAGDRRRRDRQRWRCRRRRRRLLDCRGHNGTAATGMAVTCAGAGSVAGAEIGAAGTNAASAAATSGVGSAPTGGDAGVGVGAGADTDGTSFAGTAGAGASTDGDAGLGAAAGVGTGDTSFAASVDGGGPAGGDAGVGASTGAGASGTEAAAGAGSTAGAGPRTIGGGASAAGFNSTALWLAKACSPKTIGGACGEGTTDRSCPAPGTAGAIPVDSFFTSTSTIRGVTASPGTIGRVALSPTIGATLGRERSRPICSTSFCRGNRTSVSSSRLTSFTKISGTSWAIRDSGTAARPRAMSEERSLILNRSSRFGSWVPSFR